MTSLFPLFSRTDKSEHPQRPRTDLSRKTLRGQLPNGRSEAAANRHLVDGRKTGELCFTFFDNYYGLTVFDFVITMRGLYFVYCLYERGRVKIKIVTTILISHFNFYNVNDLCTTATCQQRPLILCTKSGSVKMN